MGRLIIRCGLTQEGVKPDDRSLWISQMMSLTPARISPLMYPRLLPLRKIMEGLETMEELPDGVVSKCALVPAEGICCLLEDAAMHMLSVGGLRPCTCQHHFLFLQPLTFFLK
jgi:hypothetical protein